MGAVDQAVGRGVEVLTAVEHRQRKIRNAQPQIITIWTYLNLTFLFHHCDHGHPTCEEIMWLQGKHVYVHPSWFCMNVRGITCRRRTLNVRALHLKILKLLWECVNTNPRANEGIHSLTYRKCFVHMWWVNSEMITASKMLQLILLDGKFHSYGLYSREVSCHNTYGPVSGNVCTLI